MYIQWHVVLIVNPATLGTSQSVLIRRFVLGSILWDIFWSGLIPGVQIKALSQLLLLAWPIAISVFIVYLYPSLGCYVIVPQSLAALSLFRISGRNSYYIFRVVMHNLMCWWWWSCYNASLYWDSTYFAAYPSSGVVVFCSIRTCISIMRSIFFCVCTYV